MICSSLCRVPFIAVLLLRFERTHILRGPVFGGWVNRSVSFFEACSVILKVFFSLHCGRCVVLFVSCQRVSCIDTSVALRVPCIHAKSQIHRITIGIKSTHPSRVVSFKISPNVYHLVNINVSFHLLYLLSRQSRRKGGCCCDAAPLLYDGVPDTQLSFRYNRFFIASRRAALAALSLFRGSADFDPASASSSVHDGQ